VLHLLTETLLGLLEALVEAHALPAADAQVRMLAPLHALATKAAQLRSPERRQQLLARWSATSGQLLHKALPIVAGCIADDRIAEAGKDLRTAAERAPALPKEIGVMLTKGIARHLVLAYMVRM
jgi:hypothetical protein